MKLYLMRHGITVWNEKKRTQGRVHNRLSKSGILECEKISDILKDVKIDCIFCSPLLRTVQTANIVNKHHKCKVIKDERIIDIDQGIFTGRYFNSLTPSEQELKSQKDKSCKMESLQEMYLRVKPFFDEIMQKYKNKTILIVTHGGVASFLEKMIFNKNYEPKIFNQTNSFHNAGLKCFDV